MDYPKSVPGVGLVDGKFVDEDKTIPRAGSLIPAGWGNAITDEVLSVLQAAGLVPDEADHAQLLAAIRIVCDLRYPKAYSISELPEKDVGPITVIEAGEVWLWSGSQYFNGYRSPLCGRPLDGHTVTPLASEVDAVGGVLSKAAYAALWGYAQENSLVVPQANWDSNRGGHFFVDVSATEFRAPDLRNRFRRYTGSDADTGLATTLGFCKTDSIKSHAHSAQQGTVFVNSAVSGGNLSSFAAGNSVLNTPATAPFGTAETAPKHVGYLPRIHI